MIQFVKHKALPLLLLLMVMLCCFNCNAQVAILNKSFEGITPPSSIAPIGWSICSGTPDIQPGAFCVSLTPSDGNACAGLGAQFGVNGAETIGQLLSSPLQKDKQYRLDLDLSLTNSVVPNCGGFNVGIVTFELWAGNCICCKSKLLAKVDTVSNVGWQKYSLYFVPDASYSFIVLVSDALKMLTNRYLLVDNLSDFIVVPSSINFTTPSKDTTVSCAQTISGSLIGAVSKVELKSTLLNKTVLATQPNSNSWTSVGFEYPESCVAKKDTLEVTGYFIAGDTVRDKIVVDVNCISQDCIISKLVIPNLITPNRDGRNDFFEILGLPTIHKLELYNRWGERVFESSAYKNDWQGEEGVYYYLLTLEEKSYKGWLQVLK